MKLKPGSLQAAEFIKRLATDIQYEPDWRTEAARAEAYFDSLQLDPAIRAFMEDRGQPVVINNLIQPIINGVIGMEAKTRTDYRVNADDDAGVLVAEALNERMNEHVRISKVHRANSDAFKRMVIGGCGWVEVRRNPDPFGADYLVDEIDWREVFPDWRARRADMSDARYIARVRWVDEDMACAMMPNHAELIKRCLNGSTLAELEMGMLQGVVMPDLVGPYTTDLQSQYDKYGGTFVNPERRQVKILQVQYRVPEQGLVLRIGDTKVRFDKTNRFQVAAVESGRAKLYPATYTTMRHAWFIGPHLVHDGPSPYPHDQFNLVRFAGFLEGGTGKPYGLVRNMMSAQDEVNFRRSMLTWLLKASVMVKDQDAFMESDEQIKTVLDSMNGVLNLNPARKVKADGQPAYKLLNDRGTAQQHFSVMQDAMKQLQDLVGVYNSFLGQDSSAKSGVAINSLVEQATVTLSDLFDNHQSSRQQVGELMLSMIEEDIGNEETRVAVNVNENVKTKVIVLNERVNTDKGTPEITNRVQKLKRHVVLANVQSSPGYRAQMLTQMMELAQTLPDAAKLVLLEDIIRLSEMPRKNELINKIKEAVGLGINPEDMDEEAKQRHLAKQEQQKQELELLMRERLAEVANKEGSAAKYQADAQLVLRKIEALNAEQNLDEARAAEILTRIERQSFETDVMKKDRGAQMDAQIDAMLARLGNDSASDTQAVSV